MILSISFSKPCSSVEEILGAPYIKIRFSYSKDNLYKAEFFTQKQVFHKNFSEREVLDFFEAHAGKLRL